MRIFICILTLCLLTYASNFESVEICSGDNCASVTADSALHVTWGDTLAVTLSDTLYVHNLDTVPVTNIDTVSVTNVDTVSVRNVDTVSVTNVDTVSVRNVDTLSVRNIDTLYVNSIDTVWVRQLATTLTNAATQLRVTIFDSTGTRTPAIDGNTHALMTVMYEHHEVHEGSHYFVQGFKSVAANDSLRFGFFTRNTAKQKHVTWKIAGSGQTSFSVWESATFDTTSGGAVTAYNNNRNSLNTSTALLRSNPTFSAVGDSIAATTFGTTTNPASYVGGASERSNELILKNNTYYRFRFINGNSVNRISYTAEWYEHTPKE